MTYLPYKDRIVLSETDLIEINIKEVGTKRELKFSLVLIRDKDRLVGFDNYHGQEPHKHIKGKIYPYEFETVDKLIDDFYTEIQKFIS